MNGISKSPIPGALPRSTRPPLRGPTAHEGRGSGDPCRRRSTRGEPRRPRKGRRGWVLRRSLDRFRKKGDRHERARMGGGKRGKGAELTQAWALGAAVAVECGPATRNSSPGGRAGVGLPKRRLLPLVPPPPELRLPRKLIAT